MRLACPLLNTRPQDRFRYRQVSVEYSFSDQLLASSITLTHVVLPLCVCLGPLNQRMLQLYVLVLAQPPVSANHCFWKALDDKNGSVTVRALGGNPARALLNKRLKELGS